MATEAECVGSLGGEFLGYGVLCNGDPCAESRTGLGAPDVADASLRAGIRNEVDTAAGGLGADRLTVLATPNPGSGDISIRYQRPGTGTTRFTVVDVNGRRIWSAADAVSGSAGTLTWNRMTDEGIPAPAGTYLLLVTSEDGSGRTRETLSQKLVLLR
ncbi:MAG: T9SS type A sorting domain-containing protein [Candidatus Eisenbacteria bacterium]